MTNTLKGSVFVFVVYSTRKVGFTTPKESPYPLLWTAASSDSCPLTCLVWVALSGAYNKASIALQIITGHANLLTVRREKVAVLEEINLLLTQICSLKSQSLYRYYRA